MTLWSPGRKGKSTINDILLNDKKLEIKIMNKIKHVPYSTTDARKKIIFIQSRAVVGGPINVVRATACACKEFYETLVITGRAEKGEELAIDSLTKNGIRTIMVREIGEAINPFLDLLAMWKIYKIVKREKPSIVHTHTAKAGALGRLAAWLAGVPIIIHTFHGQHFEGYFPVMISRMLVIMERFLSKITTKIVAVSPKLSNELSYRYKIASSEKLSTIPIGIDLERFLKSYMDKGFLRNELQIDEQTIIIAIIGRLVPIKNHEMFLKEAKKVRFRSNKKLKFVVVGDGKLRDYLQLLVNKLGISNDTFFLGLRKDVEKIYADADIVVLTSKNEGLPFVLIEAMASGKPVVAAAVGGVSDVVKNGETGLLVKPSEEEIANGILKLINDDGLRVSMGQKGRKRVSTKFTEDSLVRDTLNLYKKLQSEINFG